MWLLVVGQSSCGGRDIGRVRTWSQTCAALAEIDPKSKPFLLSLSPSCSPGDNRATSQRLPSQTFSFFFFLAREAAIHSSSVKHYCVFIPILPTLLERETGQMSRSFSDIYQTGSREVREVRSHAHLIPATACLLCVYPAIPAQVAGHFSGEERDTAHLQTHMANRVGSMASIPHCMFI